jgi:hypothetical protein
MTQPTETPPAEGSTGMVRSEHANDSNSGPVAGNRTPMTIGFLALVFLLALIAAAVVAGFVQLAR